MEDVVSWIDTLLVVAGLGLLVARQFLWRVADPGRLFGFPLSIVGIGLVWMVWEVLNGEPLTLFALAAFGVETVLVFATGSVMGSVAQLREQNGVISYRLASAWGLVLWGLFLAIRVGSFLLASKVGAHLLDTNAVILLSFGINRLANSVVVGRRIERQSPAAVKVAGL